MMVSRASPELRIVWTKSLCSLLRWVSVRRLVMPMTPFIGVRISWDIEARNSLFAREAASASTFARRRLFSISTRAVMSFSMMMKFSSCPPLLRTACISTCR